MLFTIFLWHWWDSKSIPAIKLLCKFSFSITELCSETSLRTIGFCIQIQSLRAVLFGYDIGCNGYVLPLAFLKVEQSPIAWVMSVELLTHLDRVTTQLEVCWQVSRILR